MTRSKAGKTAFAIFVKTPGLSRVKTRLGHKVGEHNAKKFYELSLNKIKSEFTKLEKDIGFDQVDIYWALAEPLNPFHSLYWKDYKFIHQKGEHLGTRISSIYNQLVDAGYKKVILMGADSPQLTSVDYMQWYSSKIKEKQVILGPASDGGFYTFIGASKISTEIWESVNYSESTTAEQLDNKLVGSGFNIFYLNKQMDIDFYDDLEVLGRQLAMAEEASVEQQALLNYISTHKFN